jgi:N-methylhydantoinase A
MQVNEIEMPLDGSQLIPEKIRQLETDFHNAHKKRYEVNDPASYIELTDWRVVGIGVIPKLMLKEQPYSEEDASIAIKSKRSAYFQEAGGFIETPIYDGNKLTYGMKIDGPAIIEDPLTTTVIIPDSKVVLDKMGSYVMELSQ